MIYIFCFGSLRKCYIHIITLTDRICPARVRPICLLPGRPNLHHGGHRRWCAQTTFETYIALFVMLDALYLDGGGINGLRMTSTYLVHFHLHLRSRRALLVIH